MDVVTEKICSLRTASQSKFPIVELTLKIFGIFGELRIPIVFASFVLSTKKLFHSFFIHFSLQSSPRILLQLFLWKLLEKGSGVHSPRQLIYSEHLDYSISWGWCFSHHTSFQLFKFRITWFQSSLFLFRCHGTPNFWVVGPYRAPKWKKIQNIFHFVDNNLLHSPFN